MIDFTLNAQNRPNLIEKIAHLDCSNQLWQVTIRPYKAKRSLNQNNWARKFAYEFGKHIGYHADEAYDLLMFKCNPIFKTDPQTGNEIRLNGHLSKLNTAEAAEVQERMIMFGETLGFYFDEVYN